MNISKLLKNKIIILILFVKESKLQRKNPIQDTFQMKLNANDSRDPTGPLRASISAKLRKEFFAQTKMTNISAFLQQLKMRRRNVEIIKIIM